jgi:hypothetical protein
MVLKLLRKTIIRRLNKAQLGKDHQNYILESLGLKPIDNDVSFYLQKLKVELEVLKDRKCFSGFTNNQIAGIAKINIEAMERNNKIDFTDKPYFTNK